MPFTVTMTTHFSVSRVFYLPKHAQQSDNQWITRSTFQWTRNKNNLKTKKTKHSPLHLIDSFLKATLPLCSKSLGTRCWALGWSWSQEVDRFNFPLIYLLFHLRLGIERHLLWQGHRLDSRFSSLAPWPMFILRLLVSGVIFENTHYRPLGEGEFGLRSWITKKWIQETGSCPLESKMTNLTHMFKTSVILPFYLSVYLYIFSGERAGSSESKWPTYCGNFR